MTFSLSLPDRISYVRSLSVMIAGYLVINRNEELRDYLLDKTPSLGFIGLVPPYVKDARPQITLYSLWAICKRSQGDYEDTGWQS